MEVGEVGKAEERDGKEQRKERKQERKKAERDTMTHAPFPCAARTTHSRNREENEKKDGREQKEGGG